MEKENFIKLLVSSVGAYLSNKLGILFPILCILLFCMTADYVTGIVKAKYLDEIESEKGAWGIIKKAMYALVVAVAIICDYIIINTAEKIGISIPLTTFFGLLVSIWLILNEIISILENLIKMDVPIPPFLKGFISSFKIVVEGQGNKIQDNFKKE